MKYRRHYRAKWNPKIKFWEMFAEHNDGSLSRYPHMKYQDLGRMIDRQLEKLRQRATFGGKLYR